MFIVFSYLNSFNEECNKMDHGWDANNHERAEGRRVRKNVQMANARDHNNVGLGKPSKKSVTFLHWGGGQDRSSLHFFFFKNMV